MISESFKRIHHEISKAYIGDSTTISALAIAMFTGGHVLLEGIPGLAKTTLAKALAQTLAADFHRIQFTMDLMPMDITGSNIYRIHDGSFSFIPGPVFTNVLLADEINRASARTQSALLEAMQENQVSVDGKTYSLPNPFFVIATQNESDERGTWPLPDSELDRFMFRIRMTYPSSQQEQRIIMLSAQPDPVISPVLSIDEFLRYRQEIQNVRVSETIATYITMLIRQTRKEPDILRGASPRAGAMLLKAARGSAFLQGSEFVTPDHVRDVITLVLNHRLILAPDAPPVDEIIQRIVAKVPFK